MPPAPATFSITTGCLRMSDRGGARMRASTSLPPPAANGAINVTGREGQASGDSWAAAGRMSASRIEMAIGARYMAGPKLMAILGLDAPRSNLHPPLRHVILRET